MELSIAVGKLKILLSKINTLKKTYFQLTNPPRGPPPSAGRGRTLCASWVLLKSCSSDRLWEEGWTLCWDTVEEEEEEEEEVERERFFFLFLEGAQTEKLFNRQEEQDREERHCKHHVSKCFTNQWNILGFLVTFGRFFRTFPIA